MNSVKSLMLRYEQLREKGFAEEDGTKVNQVAKALAEVGIKIIDNEGNFRNFGTVMDELGEKWDSLDNRHRAYISTQMAGIYQGSRFQNLMENYSDSVKLYEGALESAGTTQSKYNIWLGGTEAHINQLKATAEGLWLKIFDSQAVQNGIDMVNGLVIGLEKMVTTFGTLQSVGALAMGTIAMLKPNLRAVDFGYKFDENNKMKVDVIWNSALKSGFTAISSAITDVKNRYKALNDGFATGVNLTGNVLPSSLQKVSMGFQAVSTSSMGALVKIGALKVGMLALNMVSGLLMGALVNLVAVGIMKMINSTKELEKNTATLVEGFKHAIQDNNNNIQSLSSMADEYKKLSNTTNKTAEEQKKFNELNNQIAQMSPELVQGYDNQGNAMINLKNGIDGVIESLQEKNKLESQKLVANGGDTFQNFVNQTQKAQKEMDKLNDSQKQLSTKGFASDVVKDRQVIKEYSGSIEELENRYRSLSQRDKDSAIGEKLKGDIEHLRNEMRKNTAQMDIYRAKLDEARNNLMPFIQAILTGSNAYEKLSASMKKVVQNQLQSTDFTQFKTLDEVTMYVDKLANSMNSPEFVAGKERIERLKEQFNNGTISASEFHSRAMEVLISIASMIDGMDATKLAKLFDIDMSSPTQKIRTFNEVMEDVDDELQKGAVDIENSNKALERHAETGEWDMKTILSLAKTYPELLGKLGDEKALELELQKIKNDRVGNAEKILGTELNALSSYISSASEGYGVDVLNFKSAMEAKLALANEFAQRLNSMSAQFSALASSNGASDEEAWQRGEHARQTSLYINTPKINSINTALDTYYAIKGFQPHFGSYAGGIGSSGYDGRGGGGGGGSSSTPKDDTDEKQQKALELERTIVSALKKQYEEDYKNKQDALKKKEQAEVNYYNGRVKELQDEIDALNDTREEQRNDITKLKSELAKWRNDDSIYAKQKVTELEKVIKEREKQLSIQEKENQKKTLQDELNLKQEAMQKEQEALQKQYEQDISDANLYAKARTLITNNAQSEMVALLVKYEPEFAGVGALLGQALSDAMLAKVREGLGIITGNSSGGSGQSSSNIAWDGKYHRFGERSEAVRRIQQNLGITADGIWGSQTEEAVRRFQRNNGLAVDGIVGNLTWSKLIKFDTGGMPTTEGLAFVHDKERILSPAQTKAFEDLIYNLLPQIGKLDSIDKVSKGDNVFNAPIVHNDIEIVNNTPFDANNNMDSLNKAIISELRSVGYRRTL